MRRGVQIPPSLRNIYQEIYDDTGIDNRNACGELTPWTQQGVLLLNTVLTVRAGQPRRFEQGFRGNIENGSHSICNPVDGLLPFHRIQQSVNGYRIGNSLFLQEGCRCLAHEHEIGNRQRPEDFLIVIRCYDGRSVRLFVV